MTSLELIPESGNRPLGIGVESRPCYACGESLPHFDMARLHVSVAFDHQKTGESMGQTKVVYLCPDCARQGQRFASAPLSTTVHMSPGGRNAKKAV